MMKPNGTDHTQAVAERIRDVADQFRALGVPVFLIYYGFDDEDHTTANGGLHMVEYKPERGDTLVRKEEMSPFRHSDIDGFSLNTVLKERGLFRPFAAGFHATLCMTEMGLDALDEGYEVNFLEDCIGEHDTCPEPVIQNALRELERQGAKRCTSETALNSLRSFLFPEPGPVFA